MYTGGNECVLVKWLLKNPQNKAYLPRLPAPIRYVAIAPSNIHVSISTIDNGNALNTKFCLKWTQYFNILFFEGIVIINAQREIISTIQNFTWSTETSVELFPAGLTLDPLTNSLVFNSRVGNIQFFKTDSRTLLYNVSFWLLN